MPIGEFDILGPEAVIGAVEKHYGLDLDGVLVPYSSYVNRVYGVRSDEGTEFVAKFYRPGRWTREAILEEHRFVSECAAAEIPVAAPLLAGDGTTLSEAKLSRAGEEAVIRFALYPKKGGRNFDAESDDDWLRLGSLAGRIHAVASSGTAPARPVLRPETLTAGFIDELLAGDFMHPDVKSEFEEVCRSTLSSIVPAFGGTEYRRVHGDMRRANILDRSVEGLIIIDFDDMMTAPPVQDLWLLLPDHAEECGRELTILLEGYERFARFDASTVALIEPLRFMRMIHFLAWQSRQRFDFSFGSHFPDWGTKAFWEKETEDLRDQASAIRRGER